MFKKIMLPFCCVLWACLEMVLDLIRLGGRNFTLHCVLKNISSPAPQGNDMRHN